MRYKNDVSEFLQNEIKQKLNLDSKEKYQTLVAKRIITTLEKQIEFLQTEICSKNEIINKFRSNNTHKKNSNNNDDNNSNDNMEGEIWDFGDTFNTSDSQSVCSTDKSGGTLVKFRDVNTSHTLQEETLMFNRKPYGRKSTRNIFTALAVNLYL